MKRLARWSLPIGAIALLLSIAGWSIDAPMFFAAWLAAFWFCLGVILGASAQLRIHDLTGGAWGTAIRSACEVLQRRLVFLLPLFVPVLFGIGVIYPFRATPEVLTEVMKRPQFQQFWFEPAFLFLRLALYAVALVWLTRRAVRRSVGAAALGLIVQMVVTSLAAVDLLMSLVPGWSSSVFGWLVMTGQLSAGAASAVVLASLDPAAPTTRHAADRPPVWRDLGNLLMMFVLLQGYLQFMQFLVIWSEDLPRETSWFLPRLQTDWSWIALLLIALEIVIPLLALLQRRVKDQPRRLAWVAGLLVVAQAIDSAWLVAPSIDAHSANALWLMPLVMVGMVMLVFGPVPRLVLQANPREIVDGSR